MEKRKKIKVALIDELHRLELLQESVEHSEEEYLQWSYTRAQLEQIYLEEERYWKNRSKQQWLEEGDQNTKYFNLQATHRSK